MSASGSPTTIRTTAATSSISTTEGDDMTMQHREIRYGMIKLKNGVRVLVPDGKKKIQVTVGDRTRYPDAKVVARCLTCKKDWPTDALMVAEHPSAQQMKDAQEVHLWAFYSA